MQEEYIKRINSVLAYIDDNLDADLSLPMIANIAFYSPFHLHRLFKAITNETINNYIVRKRIERAATMLIHNKKNSITEIGVKCGFKNDSTFSRTFKKIYSQSPSEFRKFNLGNFSKIGKLNSNNGKETYITEEYLCNINNQKNWIKMSAKIEIVELPKMNLAYVTHIGVNGVESAFGKIVKWATPKDLLSKRDNHICRVFHDSFKVTDEDKVRMSIGVLTKHELTVDGEIGLAIMEKGKNIIGHFTIEPKEFEKAWEALFIWMHENGYKKANRNPFEIYHNDFNEHLEKKCVVDLCIPIES
jgi:AraC family transcriptional regulator